MLDKQMPLGQWLKLLNHLKEEELDLGFAGSAQDFIRGYARGSGHSRHKVCQTE